jgi:membrane protein YqaA with SNARE-associated domain
MSDNKTNTAEDTAVAGKKPGIIRRLYDWVLHWADTPYGGPALFLNSFAESSFFPIPPDPLLMALSLGKPRRALRYALYCSVASVLGGLLGFWIGAAIWHLVRDLFFSYIPGFDQEIFDRVQQLYRENDFWVVFTAGFTPIPYKVITIGAGVFGVNLPVFILASVISRSARFFLVAGLIRLFGQPIKSFIDRYFNLLTILFMVLLVGGFLVIKYLLH